MPSKYICRFCELDSWLTTKYATKILSEKFFMCLFLHFRPLLFSSVCISQPCDNVTVFSQSDNRIFLEELKGKTHSSSSGSLWLISYFSMKYDSKRALLCYKRLDWWCTFSMRLFYNYFFAQNEWKPKPFILILTWSFGLEAIK